MRRVLVIDDQEPVRAALVISLQACGFEVETAHDGATSLRLFQSSKFDLAIVDIYMPGVDGIKLIKALRERSRDLPIIAMSGVMLNGSEHTALDYLPDLPAFSNVVCLKKPFRAFQLLKAIETAMAVAA
jgi:CheY-like chemotaxis protein